MAKINFLYALMFVTLLGSFSVFAQPRISDKLKLAIVPNPIVELVGKEAFQSNGELYLRYKLRVKNSSAYTDALFKSSPELAACGQNQSASRTWVSIHEAGSNDTLNTFCAFNDNGNLQSIWFAVKQGQAPDCVYVMLNDRKMNKTYKSNKVCMGVVVQPVGKADLRMEQFFFMPQNDKSIRIKITNLGNATAPASKLRLTVRKINGVAVGRTIDAPVSSLTPGQSIQIIVNASSILPINVNLKDTTFRLNLDFFNAVVESNETNNELWHNL